MRTRYHPPAGIRRPPEAPARGDEVLLVLRDGALAGRIRAALLASGRPHAVARSAEDALRRLVGPGEPPGALLFDPRPGDGALLDAALDPFGATRVLVLGEDGAGCDSRGVMAALDRPPDPARPPAWDPVALGRGLARNEIILRYQPIVRVADRRPVGFEGLARWLPAALGVPATGPEAERRAGLTPESFVLQAEQAGLAVELARAVARRAAADLAWLRAAHPALMLPVSVNLPVEVLLRNDTVAFLRALCRGWRLPPAALRLEMTETSPVRDWSALRRALLRLREAGHGVVVDDMALGEDRDALMSLPFSGIKLDRGLVGAMPASRRARATVERLVARAHARRMHVTAEGISCPALWRAAAAAGVDRAQGYAVGRPVPASAVPAWAAAWARSRRRPPPGEGDQGGP